MKDRTTVSDGNGLTPKKVIYSGKAEKVIKNLTKRQIEGIYCADSRSAVAEICSRIPERSVVALGGSETILESGLVDALRKMDIDLLDR